MLLRLSILLFAILLAWPAHADVKQCIEDHKNAQEDDKAGRLISARDRFQRCAAAECPEMIRDECKLLHTQTQNRIPSVVITTTTTATVSVDGGPRIPLTSTAIELDPGSHTFAVQSSDGRTQSETVTLTAGMKNHAVRIEFGPQSSPGQPTQPLPTPGPPLPQPPLPQPGGTPDGPSYTGPIVMTIVGGGALVLFGLLAGAGFAKQNELDDCKPNCTEEDVQMMRTRYLGADIMLGVAGASLATALIWWLVVRGDEPATQAGSVELSPGGVSISF